MKSLLDGMFIVMLFFSQAHEALSNQHCMPLWHSLCSQLHVFFASLQWLFQHQRKNDDADSDTQASDHDLAQPVEVPGASDQCDYEIVDENEDQNFSALKSILQSPLHESEVVSKEDKKDKLESKNIKGENLEAKEKKRRKLPDPVHKKRKSSELPWRMNMQKVPEPEKLPPLPPPTTPHPDVLRTAAASSSATKLEEPMSAEEKKHYEQLKVKTDKQHRSGGINKAVVLARAYKEKDWEKCDKLVDAHLG